MRSSSCMSVALLALTMTAAMPAQAAEDAAKTVDVTEKVAAEVKGNTLSLVAGNDLFGEPAEGEAKTLRVQYTAGDKTLTAMVPEGRSLTITLPAEQKLVIRKAVYGVITGPADVTAVVAAAAMDNTLSMAVNSSMLGIDPSPMTVKQLSVRYTVGGATRGRVVREGAVLRLAAPAGEKLVIVSALYGKAEMVIDVTDEAAAAVKDNRLSIKPGGNLFGDPAPMKPKQMSVEYTIDGKMHSVTVNEGQALVLPAATDGPGTLVVTKAVYGALAGK